MNKQEIVDAIINGFHQASEEYLDWSADQTIHDAGIEFLATTNISRSIIQSGRTNGRNAWVYLEMPFEDIEQFADIAARKRGRPRSVLEGRPRVDIAYFENVDRIKGVIEVKRHLSYSNLSKDFERVCALVEKYGRPNGCLNFGCVVAVRPVTNSQRKSIEEIASDIRDTFVSRYDQRISMHVDTKILRPEEDITYRSSEYSDANDEDQISIKGFAVACFYITAE